MEECNPSQYGICLTHGQIISDCEKSTLLYEKIHILRKDMIESERCGDFHRASAMYSQLGQLYEQVHELEQMSPLWDEFVQWKIEVDSENYLDAFDLALGWFSGRGLNHDDALVMAQTAEKKFGEKR